MLRQVPVDEAKEMLSTALPETEWKSIYYSRDVAGPNNTLYDVAKLLGVEVPTVKDYRRNAYKKLTYKYFPEKRKAPWLE